MRRGKVIKEIWGIRRVDSGKFVGFANKCGWVSSTAAKAAMRCHLVGWDFSPEDIKATMEEYEVVNLLEKK